MPATRRRVDTLATHLLSAWYVANDLSPSAAPLPSDVLSLSRYDHGRSAGPRLGTDAVSQHSSTAICESRQQFLSGALDRFEDIGQRFCAVHGCESIAWWLAVRGRLDESRALLAAAEGLRARHRRYRSGFEEPATNAAVAVLGERPDPDPHAQLDATIDAARAHLDAGVHARGG